MLKQVPPPQANRCRITQPRMYSFDLNSCRDLNANTHEGKHLKLGKRAMGEIGFVEDGELDKGHSLCLSNQTLFAYLLYPLVGFALIRKQNQILLLWHIQITSWEGIKKSSGGFVLHRYNICLVWFVIVCKQWLLLLWSVEGQKAKLWQRV